MQDINFPSGLDIALPAGSDRNKVEFLTNFINSLIYYLSDNPDNPDDNHQPAPPSDKSLCPIIGEYEIGDGRFSGQANHAMRQNFYINFEDKNGNDVSEIVRLFLSDGRTERQIYLHIIDEDENYYEIKCRGVFFFGGKYNFDIKGVGDALRLPESGRIKVGVSLGGRRLRQSEGVYGLGIDDRGRQEDVSLNHRQIQGPFFIGNFKYVSEPDTRGLWYGQFAADTQLTAESVLALCPVDSNTNMVFGSLYAMEGERFSLVMNTRSGRTYKARDVEFIGYNRSARKLEFKLSDYSGKTPSGDFIEDTFPLNDGDEYYFNLIPKGVLSNNLG